MQFTVSNKNPFDSENEQLYQEIRKLHKKKKKSINRNLNTIAHYCFHRNAQ